MTGEPIEQVRSGMQMLVAALKQDPQALETAYLSVITFNSNAQQASPLTELAMFQAPDINASGTTSMGAALTLVADCASREVTTSTAEVKGDWKPMVWVLSDGVPTDDLETGIKSFKAQSWGKVIALAVNDGDADTLKKITPDVVSLETANPGAMAAFFEWMSTSVKSVSAKLEKDGVDDSGESSGLNELPPPPPEINVQI